MILKQQLMVIAPTEKKVAVIYTDKTNYQYSFNGMPGTLLQVLLPKLLNTQVDNISISNDYLTILIKNPYEKEEEPNNSPIDISGM